MTLSQFLRSALLIIVAVALVPHSASAQKRARARKAPVAKKQHAEFETDFDSISESDPETAPEKSHEMPPLARKFLSEVGGIGLDFWTNRLNAYKVRIDRTLNECDLAELNRMRVYWSMFLDNKGWNEIGLTGRRIFEGEGEGTDNPAAGNGVDAVAQGIDKLSELAETIFVARSIARRYRTEMNGIRDEMQGDLSRFVDTLIAAKDAFQTAHRAEIEADPETREGLEKINRASLEEITGEIGRGKEVGLILGLVLEPVMMLYNGQDLRRLLKDVDVLPRELEGISIPDNPVLAQSRPNPASGSAVVSYTLAEPASHAVIRLYDQRGDLAGTFDQGAQGVGTHEAPIDVSTLPTGAYLYQLSVTTAQGERVYSRTMQVVR